MNRWRWFMTIYPIWRTGFLASTSTQMRSVGVTAYGSAEHIINKASDIDLAIRHRATRIVVKNKNLVDKVVDRMPDVQYLDVSSLELTRLPVTFSDPLSRSRFITSPSILFASSLPSLNVSAALSVSILENLIGFPVSDVTRSESSSFLSMIFFDILSRSSDLI